MISFFKNFAKIILYLVLLALVGAGVYAGLKIYENETAKSSSFGEIKQHNLYEDFNPSNYTISDGIAHYKVACWKKYRNGNHLLVVSDGKKYRLDGVQAGKRNSNHVSILIKY